MIVDKSSDSIAGYRDIFELRGHLYHEAMTRFPDARANEFLATIGEAAIGGGMTVVDVPSGGGYLSRYLSDVQFVCLESSQMFARFARDRAEHVVLHENSRFPLKDGCVDRVVSIAGLHHIEDKTEVFSEMLRICKPGGRVVVSDVAEGSFVQNFLDDFVGRFCVTGHSGSYFSDATRLEIHDAGLKVLSEKILEYCWVAERLEVLAEFCRLLFGMVRADTDVVAEGIRRYLGVRKVGDGVGLNWQLRCFICER